MGNVNRRQFLITTSVAGGGLAIGVSFEAGAATDARRPWGSPRPSGPELTPWLTIAPDDTVTIRAATPEIGNGTMTQVCLNIVEELQCDWTKVRAEYASTLRDYLEDGVYGMGEGPQGYFSGRSTTADRLKLLLQVGASARERLKAAAAAQWKVPVTEIEAANSVLTHKASGRTLTYGAVAAKAATIRLAAEPALKSQNAWTILGKTSTPKMNLPAVVNGSLIYGIDVRLPNMVYAALKQSPVHGGKLKSYDAEAIKNMPGVLAVVAVDPSEPRGTTVKSRAPFGAEQSAAQSAVAVIAEHYWQARKALDALPITWDDGAGAKWKSTAQMYDAAVAALERDDGAVVEKASGDVSLLHKQKQVVEAVYVTPYSDQSCMEPLNGTALVTKDSVEVWHSAQQSKQAFWVAADEAGLAPEKVTFNQAFVGGGFGRRLFAEDLRLVVAVAKKFQGRPVQVVWSREEMMRQGRYRPMVAAKLKAGLDDSGLPAVFTARQAGKGHFPRFADSPYALGCIPNVRVDAQSLPIHVLTGAYRGPGYNSYAFMVETFMDECALAAGMDPVDYRMRLLAKWPDQGWTKVLKEVAEKSGWGKILPKGMAQGVAIANWGMNGKPQEGTTVGVVATVEVTKKGNLKVHELDVAFDTGRVINHDAVQTMMEGGVIFGLNMALNEEINVKDGRMVEGNFDTYPMLRAGDVPKINVHFGGLSGHDRFSEIGEPPVGPVGPAVGNAVFRATGIRIRSTPIRKHDLSWA